MKRSVAATCCLAFLLLPSLCVAVAQEPSAKVRASVQSEPQPWVGQKVILNIELLAPGYFASAPRFDFPQISGVLLIPPEGRPVLGTEEIDGQSYTVQSYEVALFAKREGSHEIPPFKIRFNIKRTPLDPQEVPKEVLTPDLSITAKLPPGAEQLGALISAHDLTAQEKWLPDARAGKVGDAFTRTIEFEASDIPGMAFPPFPATQIPGIGVYPKQPVVSDLSDRDALTGKRLDTIVYVCEQPGRFVIPAAKLTWWNIDDQALHTIDFPEHVIEIAPNPALPTGTANQKPGWSFGHISRTALFATLGFIVLISAYLFNLWQVREQILETLRPTHLEPLNPES